MPPDQNPLTTPRLEDRIATARPARILLDDGKTIVPCVISDFCSDGAGLQVPAGVALPPAFDLHLPTKITHRVQLRWRSGDRAGVAF